MRTTPWIGMNYVPEGQDYPAICVSWYAAVGFCEKLTKLERASGRLRSDEVYRLPTEAEWEYACRSGNSANYSFGDTEARLDDYAWYSENAWNIEEMCAYRVGTKHPNAWDLYDMHGNIYEWCQDAYGCYDRSPSTDPVNSEADEYRVSRGGSWLSLSVGCRSASRNKVTPDYRGSGLGFRLVRGPSSH